MVTYLTIPTWVVRLGLCIWLVTTIKGENNVAGYVCNTTMDYNLSAIMQYFKIATELIILVFFLERVIALHHSTVANSDHIQWRRLALINATITFLVILSEILVGQITVYLQDYLFLTYSLVNLIQANLVIFVVEDTKNVFRKRAAASNSASKQSNSNSGNRSNGQRDNMEEYDDRTVSYADGVSAAKVGRLNDSYNNNPASTRAFTPKSETLPVRYNSNDRPDSSIYDFSQVDQKMGPNHLWDVDADYMVNGSNRWRHGKGEDEIPMTLAKRQEDAHGFHNI
ncbi:hypothetical protein BGZ80_005438 [Entomortierella chlamydospora]|uniref:Uncharacterized protein n=1 Tax=Entomortierella chlamydospora TaxID=101097 RepID=A0A9P6SUV9_9FUNG|nr:hypothetical protein BGZ80_005438 [Entomortierella chlamydospora]KAG0005505.1 hypothetical protein BGZ79_004259 [Entomortierella chlamydospora]